MVGELFGGLSAIKTAFDMAQGLQNIHDAVARDRATIELQKEILNAQAAQAALLDRISELEKQVASFETWETEKQRYELKPMGNGVAYLLKTEAQGTEAQHPLCANCFERRQKSFLATVPTNIARQSLGMGRVYRCPMCKAEI